MSRIVSSESVNIGHPDKTCDYIADSFLDAALTTDPYAQMAVECAIKDDWLFIYGEATTTAKIDYEAIARRALKQIGYRNKFNIKAVVSCQSPDINRAVDRRSDKNETKDYGKYENYGAGDQGMVFGYATDETPSYMPLPITVAHALMRKYEEYRKAGKSRRYFPDAKAQVSVEYADDGTISAIDTVLVSVSHCKSVSNAEIKAEITENVIAPVLKDFESFVTREPKLIINPSGKFTIWGSFGDSGCTGRKIVVDTYGGVGRVGGGCFSSKNATKVDRSAAYYARYCARNIVSHKLAKRCEIQVAYAIGKAEPVSMYIDTFGTELVPKEQIDAYVAANFDFRPGSIIRELKLLEPIFRQTAVNGHFGNPAFSWEKDKD